LLGNEKPTTTLLWYAHWLPTSDKNHIDAIDDEPIVFQDAAVTGSDSAAFGCTDGCTDEESVARLEGFEPPTLRSEVTIRTKLRRPPLIFPSKNQGKGRKRGALSSTGSAGVWHRFGTKRYQGVDGHG
jgi:hypothetical protein